MPSQYDDLLKANQELQRLREELAQKVKSLNDANIKLENMTQELEKTKDAVKNLELIIGTEEKPVANWRVLLVNNLVLFISFFLVLVVVVAIIAFFVTSKNSAGDGAESGASALIKQLSEPGSARGLITFLVVVATVVIGLLLLISSFRTSQGAAESFTRGKEVFTILVGIVGTIVGFYFGAETNLTDKGETTPENQKPAIEEKANLGVESKNNEELTSADNTSMNEG